MASCFCRLLVSDGLCFGAVGAYFVPYWKQKHPGPLSRTQSNGFGSQRDKKAEYASRQAFPSHPSGLRGFNKQPTREPGHYDPRIETPFVRSPPIGDAIKLSSVNSKYLSPLTLQDQIDSHRLFSPQDSTAQQPQEHPDSVTRTSRTLTELAEYETSVRGFGDAKDYISALPEPSALKARPAGAHRRLQSNLKAFQFLDPAQTT